MPQANTIVAKAATIITSKTRYCPWTEVSPLLFWVNVDSCAGISGGGVSLGVHLEGGNAAGTVGGFHGGNDGGSKCNISSVQRDITGGVDGRHSVEANGGKRGNSDAGGSVGGNNASCAGSSDGPGEG